MQPISIVRSAIIILAASASLSSSFAQNPSPAVMELLKTQYKIVKLAPDSTGLAVIDPGTVLVIQKGGLLGIPPANPVNCAAKYQDADLKAAGGFCAAMVKDVSRFFQPGEKVYPLKIDVNAKKEQISFKVVDCDTCNGTNPPAFFKSEVQFQFPKGFLETADAASVQQAIAQVLTVDGGSAQTAAAAQSSAPADTPPPAISAPPPPADAPTPTIEVGQTVDQVTASFGPPKRIAKVGAKQIYFFQDLKVTFTDGKVSDVE